MSEIEKLKKELAEKEARLAHIVEIIRSVDDLQKERRELSDSIWGTTGRIAEAELREKSSKMPEFNYSTSTGLNGKCRINSVGSKFVSVLMENLVEIQFRVSDGKEKGTRDNSTYFYSIDVKGAIDVFNKKVIE